ncbi:universal stress protein, partial [Allopontixanthobacter sp.]|uniref:universal stress protein n=1 Tax=Allopontixanthobacter sp. TaxID=2906452 RepID=UPI002ABB5F0B
RTLREQTEKDLSNEGVSWKWIESSSSVVGALLEHSVLADLVVLGAREPRRGGKVPSTTAGELALSAHCPVLVLPEGQSRFDPAAPALVAWNGSPEASHALRSAVPFLQHSAEVYLASVKESKDAAFDLPPLNGADYLSRYGITSEIVEIGDGGKDVAAMLRDAAAIRGCGLVVMGAYGRMRLAERIFGGVTRSMLTNLQVPLLLRH